MKVNKEIRQTARALLRDSFINGRLDRGHVSAAVESLISKKPRDYLSILEDYKRLLRLEVEKHHARIESASELDQNTSAQIVANLRKKYGGDLTTEFAINPALLGGVRIRVGSDVWDSSVRSRLQRLEQEL
jgi:F-type H+-transporting ATPase subunit delta